MMASFSISRSIITFCFFTFFFKSLIADSNTSFSLKNFGQDSNFESFLAFYGDSKVVNGGSSLLLTNLSPCSVGRVVYKKPIKIYEGIPKKLVSISTYFSLDISIGNYLAFVVFPFGYPLNLFGYTNKLKVLSVEFEDDIGINSSRFIGVKVMNLSSAKLVINGSEKMQTWIDYEPGSRRLEVRLNRLGNNRPVDPLLSVQIDLLKIWPKIDGVFVGLSSSNGNSSKAYGIDSWRFKAAQSPDWVHSQPLDPISLKLNQEHEMKVTPKESDCSIKIIVALIIGIGFGSLGTFAVMFTWNVLEDRNRQAIVPEEFVVKSVKKYEHKKLKIVLDEASANGN